MPRRPIIAEVDSRKRISLARITPRASRYLIEELPHGVVILRPVEVVTTDDKLLLANPAIVDSLHSADSRSSSSHPYVRRTATH